jgi:1-acyl-sn-glycerol-3-phosphate acyltransferase
MTVVAWLAARAVLIFARALTGVQARWMGCPPAAAPRVYYANHTSHGDFVLVWGSMPSWLRAITRPVAGADYWEKSALRRFIGRDVFRALLIDRTGGGRERGPAYGGLTYGGPTEPVSLMQQAIQAGDSLIVFPEGTRNTTRERLLPLKSGIFHLARACSGVEFIPVWIDNLNRVMPKGESIPVPMLCTVTFGAPVQLGADETKDAFLARCRHALLSLAPKTD